MKTFVAALGLAALAAADNAPSYEPRYQPSYQPSYKQPAYPEEPASYQYNYEVRDEYAGLNFDANEAREGYNTNGGYNVLLPDGRTQKVAYTVEGDAGYVADVQYEGEAKYEPHQPKYEPKYEPKGNPVVGRSPSKGGDSSVRLRACSIATPVRIGKGKTVRTARRDRTLLLG